MEVLRIEAYYIGTATKPAERGRYETGKSGAWKTWHGSLHARDKGGEKKAEAILVHMHQGHT